MLTEAEEGDEFREPNSGEEVLRVERGKDVVRILWGLGKAKERRREAALKKKDGAVSDVDFVSLREITVEGGDVVAND